MASLSSSGHRLIVYYQTQYDHNPALPPNGPFGHYVSVLPLLGLITHLIVAAFHINAPGTPGAANPIALNDNSPDDIIFKQMWEEISLLKKGGVKVLGMLGGAADGTYECLQEDNFNTFYPQLAHYIRKYQLDGMDLDVEQIVEAENDVIRLITTLKRDFGSNFIITLAPVATALLEEANLSGFNYIVLEQKIGNLISWYNTQFYSGFGQLFPDDQYISIAQYDGGLIHPNKVVATVLTNPDDGYGYIGPDEIISSVHNLTQIYGGDFGGLNAWEYFNSLPDVNQPWIWAKLMKDALAKSTSPVEGREFRSRIAGRRDS